MKAQDTLLTAHFFGVMRVLCFERRSIKPLKQTCSTSSTTKKPAIGKPFPLLFTLKLKYLKPNLFLFEILNLKIPARKKTRSTQLN